MRLLIRLLLPIIFSICVAGCPSLWNKGSVEKADTPEELFSRAEKLLKDKNYHEAVETLERLKSAHPDYSKIPEVYMKLADAAYDQGSYENAASKYLQFMELYPGSKEVPRAKFNVAMSYFKQIKGTDLDSRAINLALDSFKLVAGDPNGGEWAKKAEEKIKECRKKLAEKELYKAKTYLSVSNYRAARLVAQRILDEYSDLGFDEEAKKLLKRLKDK